MARLISSEAVEATVSYRVLGLVDEACVSETHTPDTPAGSWIGVARGMVYLDCPSSVISVRVQLESWTAPPPADETQWSGSGEVDVELPTGVLGVHTLDGGWKRIPALLPSPGTYRLRLRWVFNPEAGPFHSPLRSGPLETPAGHEEQLAEVDQFCLAQVWRLSALPR